MHFTNLKISLPLFKLAATDVFDYTEFYKTIVDKPSPTIKFLTNLGLHIFKHRVGKLCFFITETGSKVATSYSCLNFIAWKRLLRTKLQKVNFLEANVLKKFVRLFVQDF